MSKDIVLDLGEQLVSFSLDKHGEVHGTVVIRGTNGTSRCEYRNGKKHGEFSESFGCQGYYSDGTNGTYKDGKKHGYWEHYEYDDENFRQTEELTYLVSEGKYDNGEKIGTWRYYRYPDCHKGYDEPYLGEEPFKDVSDSSLVMKVEERFDEPKKGYRRCFDKKDDKYKVKKTYYLNEDGEMHGPCTECNRDGSLVKEGNYQNGKKHGKWVYYPFEGEKIRGTTFFLGTTLNFDEGKLLLGGVAWPVVRPELTTEETK